MTEPFDDFIDSLQERIFEETREAYGEEGFDRWRNPRFRGPLENADTRAHVRGTCGDTMEIFLKFAGERVVEAAYLTDGCGSSQVCGSFAAEMAIGKTPDEVTMVTGESILARLGRVPEEERHCAFLAAETLQEALDKWMKKSAKVRGEKENP
jgi:nitrogen fixation NifU-like protein